MVDASAMKAITVFRRLLLPVLLASAVGCGVDDPPAARTADDDLLNTAIGDRGPEELDPDLEASPTVTDHAREPGTTMAPLAHEPHRE